LFDKSSLHEVINRYGWSKNAPVQNRPEPVSHSGTIMVAPSQPSQPAASKTENSPAVPVLDPKLMEELEASRKKIQELTAELAEKDEQVNIVSQQCEELKERGDEFEKSAFKENADLLKLKELLAKKEAQLQEREEKIKSLQQDVASEGKKSSGSDQSRLDLEKKLKEQEEKHQGDLDALRAEMEYLRGQLMVEGGVSVHDALAKYKGQAKQGAELLKQSLAESRRLESEIKALQAQTGSWEEEKKNLREQLAQQASVAKISPEAEHKIHQLESQILILEKRLHDAEAHAANSQSAVSHAMDFAYKATQDNELMKKKLLEAGIRM
jgi:chromosome segregation ATPase